MIETNAPIPGQSLTGSPKGNAWERPPESSNPEDAVQLHLENLSRPEVQKSIVDALDTGFTVRGLTEGILRSGVAAGRHSIDVSLMIAPIVHEYIKGTAEALGVPYKEGFDKVSLEEEKNISRTKKKMMTDRIIKGAGKVKQVAEEVTDEPTPEVEASAPRGIASRPPVEGIE